MIAFDSNYDDSSLDPDTERMIRVAAGDRVAFDELVLRYFDSTARIITAMMGSPAQAEDLAQEVFLRVYRSRTRYLPTAKFSTFLGTIIRNAVLNAKRSLSRRRVQATEFVDDCLPGQPGTTAAPATECDLAQRMDDQQTAAAVNEAISLLPQRQRMAIELVHFRGMNYLNAAEEMQTTRKAIKSLLGRGRVTLGDSLRDEYRRRLDG